MDRYVIKDKKKLRLGYTTGSCAAAASKEAVRMLLGGRKSDYTDIMTPKGMQLHLEIFYAEITDSYAECAVKKDSGDDPDVTDGIFIYARASRNDLGIIRIDGGEGIGRVTKPGLDRSVGEAAINSVPRMMITQEAEKVLRESGCSTGIDILIYAPQGAEAAEKTFNPRLGIIGGISIIGTSGIVEPMSEAALIESIKLEMRVKRAAGRKYLIISPGNYGTMYLKMNMNIDPEDSVKCSNFIGETIDYASELGFEGILLVGHFGKFVKLAGGIMNTHSSWADCRMQIITAEAALAGAELPALREIMDAATTDEALSVLERSGLTSRVTGQLLNRIEYHIKMRASAQMLTGAVIFTNKYGFLGKTENTEVLIDKITAELKK